MYRQALFQVTAQPEPGMLIRILNLVALRDMVPTRVRAKQMGGMLMAEVDVPDLEDAEAELIAQKMRALVGVATVRMEQMQWAVAA